MTSLRKTIPYPLKAKVALALNSRIYRLASKVGRFLWHFLEMLLAMGAGMALFHLLERLIPASSSLAAVAERGTVLHTIAMNIFMVVPMVAWMIVRGHGWRHSVEMAIAMLTPMAAVTLLCELGLDAYLPWLAEASGPAMFLGMLAAMLYRRNHYTGQKRHSSHVASREDVVSSHAH